MISVLEELYRGNITPVDRVFTSDEKAKKFKKVLRAQTQLAEQLEAALDERQAMQFHTYCSMQGELNCIEQEDLFLYAFRLGAKWMAEVLLPRENKLAEET